MGTAITYPLRGFLVPDPIFSLANLDVSGLTQRLPRPNAIANHVDPLSELVLGVSNEQQKAWEVRVARPGFPKIGQVSVIYSEYGATDEKSYRGWNPPNSVRNVRNVYLDTGAGIQHATAVTYRGTEDYLVIWAKDFGGLRARYFDASDYNWIPAYPANA